MFLKCLLNGHDTGHAPMDNDSHISYFPCPNPFQLPSVGGKINKRPQRKCRRLRSQIGFEGDRGIGKTSTNPGPGLSKQITIKRRNKSKSEAHIVFGPARPLGINICTTIDDDMRRKKPARHKSRPR